MGSSASKKNNTEPPKKVETITKKEQIIINEPNKPEESIEKNIRVNQSLIESSPFEKIDRNISIVSKSICKIKIQEKSATKYGTGFLVKYLIHQEYFYCLMSNEHIITNDIINSNNLIFISYDSEYKGAGIKIDFSKRYIKSFGDKGFDITVVEILDEDNISKDYFLFIDSKCEINKLVNKRIYIPQYAKGQELTNARGIIKEINGNEFVHLASTEYGSSGSPIFLENTIKVIGIHKQSSKNMKENYGDFIIPIFVIIKVDIMEKRNKGRYEDVKYIWVDKKYYIGQFKNNLPNGKGIKYYSNGNILYEGTFINGKFEGKGKYFYDDGEYFVGGYKNGLRNGNGMNYYKNGNIKYEGDFVDDKREGNGKYIYEDGEYYIGQWKNNVRNGKGIEYYSNGNIRYEGDFVDGKREGSGKYIFENGEYYIGQLKNDVRNGKGKEYYSNGNIKYEGDFVDGKMEGNGKYIFENGEYYIGHWKSGLPNGKGIKYYSNGNIKFEGNYINGKMEGN